MNEICNSLKTKMKYYRPGDYLNFAKFQLVSEDYNNKYRKLGDPGGYCLAWCFWYVELKINNPDLPEETLINRASRKITKYYKKTNNPYLYFIRDYSRKLTSEKDKILKKLNFSDDELYDSNYKTKNLTKVLLYLGNFFNKQ